MDFVNKAYAQLVELFHSMSVGTRIATGLLLAAVIVSLVYLFQFRVVGGDEYLLGARPFSSSELTKMEAAFAQAGLRKSEVVGNRIRIPRGQKDLYLAALAEGDALPPDFYKYLDEAAAADSPFVSAQSLEHRQRNAKQKELALIISRMRGIESATVQYDQEIKHGLTREKQKTAMVAVQTIGGQLDQDQLKAIKNVVASAYAGLERPQITITDMTGGFSYGGAVGPDGVPEDESLYASHKQGYERDWQRKIAEQLAYIPGVIVGINVELNPEERQSSITVKVDPKPVVGFSSEYDKEQTSQSPTISGRPGAQSNLVGNQPIDLRQSAASGNGESTLTERRSDVQNIPGYETIQMQRAALTPKKVTASIKVPASYFIQIWKQRNLQPDGQPPKPPDPGEITKIETEIHNKIKETVRVLLPDVPTGTNPWPHIDVSTYTDLPAALPAAPNIAATAGTWLADNWQTLALVAVGLLSLTMLRGMVRSPALVPAAATAASEEPAHARQAAHEPPAEEEELEPAKMLRHRFRVSGPDLKAELKEIVKENPDAAASILRAWIGEAA
jgi:flagellar M-ring protein FliF